MKLYKLLFITILTAFVFLLQSCVGLAHKIVFKDYNTRWVDDNNTMEITLYKGRNKTGKGFINVDNTPYDIYVFFDGLKPIIYISHLSSSTIYDTLEKASRVEYTTVKSKFWSKHINDQNKIRIYGNIKLSESINYDIDLILNCYKIEDNELDAKNYFECSFSSEKLYFYTIGSSVDEEVWKPNGQLGCYYTLSYYGKNTTNDAFIKVYFLDNRHILFNEIKNDYTEEILFSGTYTTSHKTMTVTLDTNYTFNNSDINIVFDIAPYSQNITN
ncbi:MAG: hypothetical protein LBV51_02945 [Acholeplasmatales bacterium]|jgi:hypothetical protein|nr:hypothetical protein [Acholeplasmatales bacterium]